MTGPVTPAPQEPAPQDPAPAPVDVRLTPVRAVMSTTVVAVQGGCHLSVAVDTFVRTGLRHLVVVDAEGRSGGVLSHEHVTAAWLDTRSHTAPRVEDVATDPETYVTADATVQQAARLMRDTGVDAVPVVRRDGRLIGVLTRTDLVRLLAGPS